MAGRLTSFGVIPDSRLSGRLTWRRRSSGSTPAPTLLTSSPPESPRRRRRAAPPKLRLIAAPLWVLAIAGEVYGIFGVLRDTPVNMVLLIGLLAVGGSLLWKKATTGKDRPTLQVEQETKQCSFAVPDELEPTSAPS